LSHPGFCLSHRGMKRTKGKGDKYEELLYHATS
jgi:hypothetical protein